MKRKNRLTGTELKIIACVSMLIDHVGAIILEPFQSSNGIGIAYVICRILGRISFPLFCLLLSEGAAHTSSIRKYEMRILLFALLSEVPYDAAMSGNLIDPEAQNVFFSLFIGLVILDMIKRLDAVVKCRVVKVILLSLAVIAAGLFNEYVVRGSYGQFGIYAIVLTYIIKENDYACLAEAAVLSVPNYTGTFTLLALPFFHFYNGERGRGPKMAFYVFYPAHLLLLALIRRLI